MAKKKQVPAWKQAAISAGNQRAIEQGEAASAASPAGNNANLPAWQRAALRGSTQDYSNLIFHKSTPDTSWSPARSISPDYQRYLAYAQFGDFDREGNYTLNAGAEDIMSARRHALAAQYEAADAAERSRQRTMADTYTEMLEAMQREQQYRDLSRVGSFDEQGNYTLNAGYGDIQARRREAADQQDQTTDRNERARQQRTIDLYTQLLETMQPENATQSDARAAEIEARIAALQSEGTERVWDPSARAPLASVAGYSPMQYREQYVRQAEIDALQRELQGLESGKRDLIYQGELERLPEELRRQVTEEYPRLATTMESADNGALSGEFSTAAAAAQEITKALRAQGYSPEQVNGILRYARQQQNARDVAELAAEQRERAEDRSGLANWAGNVGWGIASGAQYFDILMQGISNPVDPFTGEKTPVDYNSQAAYALGQATMQGQQEKVLQRYLDRFDGDKEKAEARTRLNMGAYQLAVSMGQSAVIAGLSALGLPAATLILGSSAATATAQEYHEQGYSDRAALAMGLIAGTVETITEKYSLDKLLDEPKKLAGKKGREWLMTALKNTGGQMLAEGSEEVASDVLNTLADVILLGDQSQYLRGVEAIMEDNPGMSRQAAEQKAFVDWVWSTVQSGIGGAVSGALFGVGGSLVGAAVNARRGQTGAEGPQRAGAVQVEQETPPGLPWPTDVPQAATEAPRGLPSAESPALSPEAVTAAATEAYQRATPVQQRLDSQMAQIAAALGFHYEPGVQKSVSSIESRIRRNEARGRGGDVYPLKDLARTHLEMNDWEDIPRVLAELDKKNIPYTAEAKSTSQGYKGLHVTWNDGGIGIELQLSTPEAWKVKMQTEEIYAKWREAEANPDFVPTPEYIADVQRGKDMWAQLALPDFSSFATSAGDSSTASSSQSSPGMSGLESRTQTPSTSSLRGLENTSTILPVDERINTGTTPSNQDTVSIPQNGQTVNSAAPAATEAPQGLPSTVRTREDVQREYDAQTAAYQAATQRNDQEFDYKGTLQLIQALSRELQEMGNPRPGGRDTRTEAMLREAERERERARRSKERDAEAWGRAMEAALADTEGPGPRVHRLETPGGGVYSLHLTNYENGQTAITVVQPAFGLGGGRLMTGMYDSREAAVNAAFSAIWAADSAAQDNRQGNDTDVIDESLSRPAESEAQATERAVNEGYPKITDADGNEHQAVPGYTGVKALDRNNYGRVVGRSGDNLVVEFVNKVEGTDKTMTFPTRMLQWVTGQYSTEENAPAYGDEPVQTAGEAAEEEAAAIERAQQTEVEANREKLRNREKIGLPSTRTETDNETPRVLPSTREEIGMPEQKPATPRERIADEAGGMIDEQIRKEAGRASDKKLTREIGRMKQQIRNTERMGRATGLTEQQETYIENLRSRLEIFEDERAARKAGQRQQENAPESKAPKKRPTTAERRARERIMRQFSIQSANRSEAGAAIDGVLQRITEKGRVTDADRRALFDTLLDLGIVKKEANETYRNIRYDMDGRRIYVPEDVRHNFGDDWDAMRKTAWRNGIFLTDNRGDMGIDSVTEEMAKSYGGTLFPTDTDTTAMLEALIENADRGRPDFVSLQDSLAEMAAAEHVDVDEVLDYEMEGLDNTLRMFAEAAGIEQDLRQRRAESEIRQDTLNKVKRLQRMGKKVGPEMKQRIQELVGDIDVMARHISPAGLESLQALAEQYKAMRAAAGWQDPEHTGNWLGNVWMEDRLSRLEKLHIDDLSLDEVIELNETVSMMMTEIENQRKLVDDERHTMIRDAAEAVRNEVQASRGAGSSMLGGWFGEDQLSPRRFLGRLAGWKDGELSRQAAALEKGGTDKLDYQMRAINYFRDFWENNAEWLKTASGKKAVWTEAEVPGVIKENADGSVEIEMKKIALTPMMRVSLLMHSRNNDNLNHILQGGLRIPDQELYKQGKIDEAYARGGVIKMQPETVRALVKDCTETEKQFADMLEKYMDGMSKDAINGVSMLLDGFERAGVGNYWPIETDAAFTAKDVGKEAVAGTVEGIGSIANERIKGAGTPARLYDAGDVLTRNIDNVSSYYGYAIPIHNFNAIYNTTFHEEGNAFSGSVKDAINQKWGSGATKYIEKLIEDVQGRKKPKNERLAKILSKVRSGAAGATLTLNPSVALSQFASYPSAAQSLGWDALAHGLTGRVDMDKVAQYTPILWSRRNSDLGVLQGEGEVSLAKKAPWLFDWISAIDEFTIKRLWAASEYAVTRDTGLTRADGDAFYQAAAEKFNRAVYDTQPNYTAFQRSQILRSDNDLVKSLTMFKTVGQQYYNMMYEAAGRLRAAQADYNADGSEQNAETLKSARQFAARTFSGLVVGNVLYATLKALASAVKHKDDDYRDEDGNMTVASFLRGVGELTAETFAGSAIFGDQLYTLIEAKLKGEKWYGPEISSVEWARDTAETLSDAISTGVSVLRGDASYASGLGAVRKIAQSIATATGLPVKNAEAWTLAATRWFAPEWAQRYESLWEDYDKSDLKGLKPRETEGGIRVLADARDMDLTDEAVTELSRLYAEGYATALPTAVPASFDYTRDGEKHTVALDRQDRADYTETWNSVVDVDALVSSAAYQVADDKEKAALLDKMYDLGTQLARAAADDGCTVDSWVANYEAVSRSGVSMADYLAAYRFHATVQADKDRNGKSISGSAKEKVIAYIDGMDLTKAQKQALYDLWYTGGSPVWTDTRPYRPVQTSAQPAGLPWPTETAQTTTAPQGLPSVASVARSAWTAAQGLPSTR